MSTAADQIAAPPAETELERTVREEQEAHDAAEAEGKLFEVPRVKVVVDETDPTVLKLAFAGSIDLDRSVKADVDFYNRLADGKTCDLAISVHVAGAKTVHRRDSEGDVDAVVQTKSLTVTDVTIAD
jgi:hypothetical protein